MNPSLLSVRVGMIGLGMLAVVSCAGGSALAQASSLFTGFQSNSTDPIQIDAAQLEIVEEGNQRISEFSGDVVVTRGDTVLKAKSIKIFSDVTDGQGDSKAFDRIVAGGNVEVRSGDQTASGRTVVVDNKKQTITMSGAVVLKQGENVITGDRLVIDLASGKAKIEQAAGKPIRGVFSPGSGSLLPGQ